MEKPKSEVLTVKIKLKVKFPRAAITRLRTLTVTLTVALTVALTVFTEMCPASFFTEIKMLL